MSRLGLARRPHEGPTDYARRIGAAAPRLAGPAAKLAGLYAQLRYGRGAGPGGSREFVRRVRSFRLRP